MRRVVLAVVVATLLLLGWGLAPTEPAPERGPSPAPPAPSLPAIGTSPPPSPQPAPEAQQVAPDPPSAALVRQTDALRERCGLAVHTHCEGPRCVALSEAPNLDHLAGWARLLLRSPRFVVATAARDLGLPAAASPCGDAVTGLSRSGAVASVPLSDGTDVWCSAPTSDFGDAERALCTRAAASRGLPARFEDGLRMLSFER